MRNPTPVGSMSEIAILRQLILLADNRVETELDR